MGGPDYVGGPAAQGSGNAVFGSNIAETDNGKNYWGGYVNDDWKITHKLTVNLGVRYDFFGLVYEHHGVRRTSFRAGPSTAPAYLLPEGTELREFLVPPAS